MERNRLKHKLQRGELAVIAGNYESSDLIDFVGSLGVFDGVWIDMEHSPVTWADLADLSRAADLWGMSSVVRVRANDPSLISLTLGEGVDGVIVPHVTTRAEAERAVDAAKFAPLGNRGTSGGRKSYGRRDHYGEANEETFVAVMIEHVDGVASLPEILQVPQIDAFYVAHHDLAQSMGLLHDQSNPKLLETFDGAIAEIVGAGRVAGATIAQPELARYLELGVRLVKAPQWRSWVAAGAASFMSSVRAAG